MALSGSSNLQNQVNPPNLPLPRDVKWKIMLELDPYTLGKMCQVSRGYVEICAEDNFWKEKIRYDFDIENPEKLSDDPWQYTWYAMHNSLSFEFVICAYEIGESAIEEEVVDFDEEEQEEIMDYIDDRASDWIKEFTEEEEGDGKGEELLEIYGDEIDFKREGEEGIYKVTYYPRMNVRPRKREDLYRYIKDSFLEYVNEDHHVISNRTVDTGEEGEEEAVIVIVFKLDPVE